MEFRPSKRMKVVEHKNLDYPHVLQLFLKPPTGDISLEEFEKMAFDRVKLLRILEQATLMGHKIYTHEWKTAVLGYLKKDGLRKYSNLIQSTGSNADDCDISIRREDHISHFILRLCYCRSNDLRDWFVRREIELFKLRFSCLNDSGLKAFIKAHGLKYTPISEEAKDSIKEYLIQSTVGYNPAEIESKDFYKVPFEEVSDLIKNRQTYLKGGYAYIPSGELVSCLVSLYRTNLNAELTFANRKLPFIDDERIMGLLHSVNSMYSGKDYIEPEKKEKIEVEDLEHLSLTSFPLCMRNLFDVVKSTHHMKHFGRLQFGLYLKGIGLSLENAIKYWKSEFTKLIDEDKFNKEYLYNIKHSYGVLGKMTNYTPYSCIKIIQGNVGPGECHGCPFKHWEMESLRKKMYDYGVQGDGMKEVLDLVKAGHFQIACSKYFIHTHGGIEPKALINHPNQYFEESREIRTNSRENIPKRTVQKKKVECEYCATTPCCCTGASKNNKTTNECTFGEDFDVGDMDWSESDMTSSKGKSEANEVSQESTQNSESQKSETSQ